MYEIGQRVIVNTGNIKLPGDIFHPATIIGISEKFIQVRYDHKTFFGRDIIEWVTLYQIDTIEKEDQCAWGTPIGGNTNCPTCGQPATNGVYFCGHWYNYKYTLASSQDTYWYNIPKDNRDVWIILQHIREYLWASIFTNKPCNSKYYNSLLDAKKIVSDCIRQIEFEMLNLSAYRQKYRDVLEASKPAL